MANRVRNKQIIVRVTEEERALIDLKMSQLPTSRLGAYMRKMAIDGYIILLDVPEIKKHTAELNAIGRNINIIARKVSQNIFYEYHEIYPLKKTQLLYLQNHKFFSAQS